MLYPLTFRPIFKERIWGGRTLQRLYKKQLPANLPIGEAWEISDRPGDESVIDRGPLAGQTLHALVKTQPRELLGSAPLVHGRFPLLIKILDAQETLSLQVHPPADKAANLQGDPKTEMWYIADSRPGAQLFAGLKRGISRRDFEEKLRHGDVAACFHQIPVRAGDAMFIPSGRVHALGAGSVIFEVQQNSDTTYRVFDWNRVGPDGKARDLHIPQSLESIEFDDIEPSLIQSVAQASAEGGSAVLADNELFKVEKRWMCAGTAGGIPAPGVIGVLGGTLHVQHDAWPVDLESGGFCLIPAEVGTTRVLAIRDSEFLVIEPR